MTTGPLQDGPNPRFAGKYSSVHTACRNSEWPVPLLQMVEQNGIVKQLGLQIVSIPKDLTNTHTDTMISGFEIFKASTLDGAKPLQLYYTAWLQVAKQPSHLIGDTLFV